MKRILTLTAIVAIVVSIALFTQNGSKQHSVEEPQNDVASIIPQVVYAGNYHIVQPGLAEILKHIPKDIGQLETKTMTNLYYDTTSGICNIVPVIFNIHLTERDFDNLGDTLKYNWSIDTIICHNSYDRESNRYTSELVSSCDTIRLFVDNDDEKIITHNFYVNEKYDRLYKIPFINTLKNWDQNKIDEIFRSPNYHNVQHNISRIITERGKLIELKYKKRINDIDYEKLIN